MSRTSARIILLKLRMRALVDWPVADASLRRRSDGWYEPVMIARTDSRRPLAELLVIAAFGASALSCSKEFDDYKRKSMSVEARVGLKMMQRSVCRELAEGEIGDRQKIIGPVPKPGSCCETAKKMCRQNEEDFAPFHAWGWHNQDYRFRYSYELRFADDGRSFTVAAYGDLDCDGNLSTFAKTTPLDESGQCGRLEDHNVDELE